MDTIHKLSNDMVIGLKSCFDKIDELTTKK